MTPSPHPNLEMIYTLPFLKSWETAGLVIKEILSASGFGLHGTWKISSIGQVVLHRRGYCPLWLLHELDCFSLKLPGETPRKRASVEITLCAEV